MASLSTPQADREAIETFRRDVIEASMSALVILDFWAEWCGPCKALGPILEKVASDYAPRGVKLVKIDVDKNQLIASQFRIQSIPTVYALFQGQPIADLTPARTERELKAYLDQILAQLPIGGATTGGANGTDFAPLIERARAALGHGDFATAHQLFAALSEALSGRVDITAGLARALIGLKRLDEAQAVLDGIDASAKEPGVAQARAALALAREASPIDDLEALRRRVEAAPDDHALRYELAGGLMAQGDRDGAAEALLEIIRRDRTWNEGAARERLLKLFDAVGLEDPWVMNMRRRLSAILFA